MQSPALKDLAEAFPVQFDSALLSLSLDPTAIAAPAQPPAALQECPAEAVAQPPGFAAWSSAQPVVTAMVVQAR